MPNYCWYSMKVVGQKDDCEAFVDRLINYDSPNHFWRIFCANVDGREDEGEVVSLYITGDCAWSLETCCRASGYSNGVDLFSINTEDLNLKMEAYSREPGMCFEEHYIYDNGECVVDQCEEIDVYWWDRDEYPTYKEFAEDHPSAPPECYFDDTDEVVTGGFGGDFERWHI